jgi:hypothetical protein
MAHDKKLKPPKDFEVPSSLNMALLAMVGIGIAAFFVGIGSNAHAAWNGYLIGFWFTLSLALSGPFIVATQHVSIAGWSATIRRIPLAYGAFVIPAIALAIPGIIGGDSLFIWFDQELVHADHILHKKAGFYNQPMFAIWTIGSLTVLAVLWYMLRRISLQQDEDGDYDHTNKLKAFSSLFLVTFVIGFSMMSWYWIMGLQPHWFSTMFNVYLFAGLFQSGLALTAIIVLALRDRGYFGDYVGERQIHDLGQLIFGFTVFYAYIGFSQFLLIWYANIPEEAIWFVTRGTPPDIQTGWDIFSLILPIAKFVVPFFILLRQDHKKNKYNILRYVALFLVFMQLYEVWYWVAPTPHDHGEYAAAPHVPLIELGVTIGFLGAFGWTVARALAKAPLIPLKDPFLHEAVEGHHHGTKPPEPAEIKVS